MSSSPEVSVAFDEIENVLRDPFAEIHARAHVLEDMINASATDLSDENLRGLISCAVEELDEAWPHRGEQMRISGQVWVIVQDEHGRFKIGEDSDGDTISVSEYETRVLEDMVVASEGFFVSHEQENGGDRFRICHLVQLPIEVVDSVQSVGVRAQTLFARVPIGAAILEPVAQNEVIDLDWLQHSYPDTMLEVDCALLNTDDTSEALRNLKGVSFVIPEQLRHDGNRANDLIRYLEYLLPLERPLPYAVTGISTFIWEQEQPDGLPQLRVQVLPENVAITAFIDGFCSVPSMEAGDDGSVRFSDSKREFALRARVLFGGSGELSEVSLLLSDAMVLNELPGFALYS